MIALYDSFVVLLWFIDIFGFIFGSVWIFNILDRHHKVGIVLLVVWQTLYIGMFLAFIFSGSGNENTYSMAYTFPTIAITVSSVFVAYAAKLGEEYLESNVKLNSKVVLLLRIIVLAVGGICIAVTGASIKSFSYHNGYSKYTFSKELSILIEKDSLQQVSPYVKDLLLLKDIKRLMAQVDPNEIFVEKDRSFWSLFSISSETRMIPTKKTNAVYKFKIFKTDPTTIRGIYLPGKTILENDTDRIVLTRAIDPIIVRELLIVLDSRIEEKQRIINDIKIKPASSNIFAFGSFLTILSAGDFIESVDVNSKKLDSYLLWFIYILTGFVFYVKAGKAASDHGQRN